MSLKALQVYAMPTPWLQQDTTTSTLSGAYEAGEPPRTPHSQSPERPGPHGRPMGTAKLGLMSLTPVLLSLGVSRDGLPLRLGVRDGNPRDSPETPGALEESMALGLDGVRGIVADRKAYGNRTLGWCLEQPGGLIT